MKTWENLADLYKWVITGLVTLAFLTTGIFLLLFSSNLPVDPIFQDALKNLGTFISVTITLSFLYRILIRPLDDKKFEDKMKNVLYESQISGFDGFENRFNYSIIFDSLGRGDTLWFLMTYEPQSLGWLDNLRNAIDKGAKVKILVMSPDSPLVSMRAGELPQPEYSETAFKNGISTFIKNLESCLENDCNSSKAIEIVKYNDLPCAPIYIVENRKTPIHGWSSYYLGKPIGVDFPHIKWKYSGKNCFLEIMHQYLVKKWEKVQKAEKDQL